MSTPLSSINRRLPASTVRPERTARRPRPGSSSKFSGCLPVDRFFSCAACTMAAARGCWDTDSTAAAMVSSPSAVPPAGQTSVTAGSPFVTVPVLSSTTVSTEWVTSKISPERIRMPCLAPRPVPTMMAVGVARPKAQGQAMTSTEVNTLRTKAKSFPAMAQITAASTAMAMTVGTKIPATLSAVREMGAFLP